MRWASAGEGFTPTVFTGEESKYESFAVMLSLRHNDPCIVDFCAPRVILSFTLRYQVNLLLDEVMIL